MSKLEKDSTGQLTFLSGLEPPSGTPGSFSISAHLKGLLSEGIRQSGMSRYEVAAKISELLGWELSKAMLDAYTAESKDGHRVPAEILPAFSFVTGYYEPLRMLCETAGGQFLGGEHTVYAEMARVHKQIEDLKARERVLKGRL
jgi:hypothetical protein